MPCLPAKDEVVSLNRFFPADFENGIIQRFGDSSKQRLYDQLYGAQNVAFHFLPDFSKKKILWL